CVGRQVRVADGAAPGLGLFGVGGPRLDRAPSPLPCPLFRLVLARAVAERAVRTGTRELARDRAPDTPRTARDEGGLAFQRRKSFRQRGVSPRACRPLPASTQRSFSRCGRCV